MRKNNKVYKITIGIPAFNEEGNIYRLLKSLVSQKLPGNFQLESIKVLSDGSTDKTVKRTHVLKNKLIKVYDYPERMGKNFRLNQLFKGLKTPILVLFDADILINDEYTLSKLVKPFASIKNLGLVAGNAQPLKSKTLIEEAINNFVESLNFMKSKIKKGDNIYSVRGPILALSKNIASEKLPLNVPEDRYLYLKNASLKYKFRYVDDARVYYRSPQTIKDQLNQGKRFHDDKENLYLHFNSKFINRQYLIPKHLKIVMFLYQI
ncbi:MAG: glycosyltransferase, partial [Nanoarchaeota archaeon]